MRFAIAFPQVVTDGSLDPAAMRTYLAEAEEFGFESAWTTAFPVNLRCISTDAQL
jgi:hypothetical protein